MKKRIAILEGSFCTLFRRWAGGSFLSRFNASERSQTMSGRVLVGRARADRKTRCSEPLACRRSKMRFLLKRALAVLALTTAAALSAGEIAARQGASAPALDLSSDVQSPGADVAVTLGFTVPDGVEVSKVVSDITYPGKLLEFQEAKRGLSAEAIEAELSTTTGPSDTSPENRVLRVTIAAKPGEWLPAGMLADLTFKISKQAPKETTVTLKNKVTAWTNKGAPVASITGKDGEITVTANPPVFACFFYMH